MTLKPRYVPIITGFFWVAIAVAILAIWREPSGILWWVRSIVFGLVATFGLYSLRIGFFDSESKIKGMIGREP